MTESTRDLAVATVRPAASSSISVFARNGELVPVTMLKSDQAANGVRVMGAEHAQAAGRARPSCS